MVENRREKICLVQFRIGTFLELLSSFLSVKVIDGALTKSY